MAQRKMNLAEFVRGTLPVLASGLLWSYLAAALLYGAVNT